MLRLKRALNDVADDLSRCAGNHTRVSTMRATRVVLGTPYEAVRMEHPVRSLDQVSCAHPSPVTDQQVDVIELNSPFSRIIQPCSAHVWRMISSQRVPIWFTTTVFRRFGRQMR